MNKVKEQVKDSQQTYDTHHSQNRSRLPAKRIHYDPWSFIQNHV